MQCNHKKIIITIKKYYTIPKGLNRENEKQDFEIDNFLTSEEEDGVFCEDCGEYLA